VSTRALEVDAAVRKIVHEAVTERGPDCSLTEPEKARIRRLMWVLTAAEIGWLIDQGLHPQVGS
jgi:hypothetical protein